MGFLSKLKAAKNFMTGGGAKVTIASEGGSLSQPFPVTVTAVVKEAGFPVDRVYVKVRSLEEVKVKDRDEDKTETVRDNETLCSFEFNIAGATELVPGESYTWTGDVVIPPGNQPTYIGRHAKHRWMVLGALDKKGNDPDSGWVDVHVKS